MADTSNELPLSALSALVSEAIDVVVHCTRVQGQVLVHEIAAVEELQTGRDSTQFTLTELFTRPRWTDPLTWTGNLPVRAARALEESGCDVRALLASGPGPAPARRSRPPRRQAVRASIADRNVGP